MGCIDSKTKVRLSCLNWYSLPILKKFLQRPAFLYRLKNKTQVWSCFQLGEHRRDLPMAVFDLGKQFLMHYEPSCSNLS